MGSQIAPPRSPSVSLLILETHVIIPWSYICVESTLIVQISLESTAPCPLSLRWLQSTVAQYSPSLPPSPSPVPIPIPHAQDNRQRNSRDATGVLIFLGSPWISLFSCLSSIHFCSEKMSENRFKVSKANSDGTEETKENYRRVNLSTDIQVNIIEPRKCTSRDSKWTVTTCSKIFFILCHTSVVTYFVIHVLVSVFCAHSQRNVGTSTRLPFFSPLEAAHKLKLKRFSVCHLLVAPEGTANRQANCVAEKAGNLALYEVKLVHILPSNLWLQLVLDSLVGLRHWFTVHFNPLSIVRHVLRMKSIKDREFQHCWRI